MCGSKVPASGKDNLAASTGETPLARLWTRPSTDSRTRGSSCRSQSADTVKQESGWFHFNFYVAKISLHIVL